MKRITTKLVLLFLIYVYSSLYVTAKSVTYSSDIMYAAMSSETMLDEAQGVSSNNNLIITEIMPANIDCFVDPSWNYGGFIELYNPTESAISLACWYLSDDPNNLKKWMMPLGMKNVKSHEYHTIWFGHNDQYCKTQCQFDLSLTGGTIYLSNSSGQLVASQEYPVAFRRVSYARKSENSNEWGWTSVPTPGSANNNPKFAMEQLDAPEVSVNGKVFTGNMQFSVSIPNEAKLIYTTDGTTPTLTNGTVANNNMFNINKTTVFRFRLFKDGYLPSEVVTRSFILKEKDYTVPIISIVTDNRNLNSDDYGIFVKGNGHGRSGRGQSDKCNWNMDWDRPVNFEFFENGNDATFSQEVNMAAVGGWSRASTPHAFKLKANKVYGINYMPYTFFKNKPYIKNKTLQIRNGGNDTSNRIKDAALQEIVMRSGIDIDCQSYYPAFVYINGKLYDVLNVREPNNKHFAYANRGLDDDEMDQFEYSPDSAYVQMAGTNEVFKKWYAYSRKASESSSYENIKKIVDIDEFINYFAVEMYLGNFDWLNNSNNVKGYRPNTDDGKFRFVLFDLDGAFTVDNMFTDVERTQTQKLDYIYDISSSLTKEIELTTIWLNMLKNQEFKRKFADTFSLVVGSVFSPERCEEIITELAERAYSAMSQMNNGQSQQQQQFPWFTPQATNYPWPSANEMISTLSSQRQRNQFSIMKNYLNLSNNVAEGKIYSNIDDADILFNDIPIPTKKFSGQFFVPVTLKAKVPSGYKFVGWKTNTGDNTSTPMTKIFDNGSSWNYYDKGSLDGQNWKSESYNTNSWSVGNAPLGYATKTNQQWGKFNTQLDWGDNEMNKRPTYYFRKTITLTKTPTSQDKFVLSYSVDDGCVIYVNGTEAGRFNMNSGNVSYNTMAIKAGDNLGYPQTLNLDPSLFKSGTNVIAVEVHNNIVNSSDLYWDATLETTVGANQTDGLQSTDLEYTITQSGGIGEIIAMYEKISDDESDMNKHVPVRINEVSASNSIYINEYWKKNDWVELYNTTDKSVDIAGMYLSDNIDKPFKYQIPEQGVNTVIEPHGYKVIWCDKLQDETQIHASFKLANETALVTLNSSDNTWADTLQYLAHNGDQTYGRYPDGSDSIYQMNLPTIGLSNTIKSFDVVYIQPKIDNSATEISEIPMTNNEEMISIGYVNNYILIKNKNQQSVTLRLSTISGMKVGSAVLDMESGCAAYETHLKPGVYVVNVADQEGNQNSLKIIVK